MGTLFSVVHPKIKRIQDGVSKAYVVCYPDVIV